MANRLAQESSPYLLQHAQNPVDWYPWGDEAFARARAEEKPLLLSVGYSACHWCHVMEHESFANEAIAALMNEHFVCIKVDREERPDVDAVYMAATQAMSGSGGWPMTVFLSPDGRPFFAGTYFPPHDAYGRPGFPTLLRRIATAWEGDREQLLQRAKSLTAALQRGQAVEGGKADAPADAVASAVAHWRASFDAAWGGFGGAPKFPSPGTLRTLLRHHHDSGDAWALEMAQATLRGMAQGGIRDHLAGGFARYSVDTQWLVPHFEKMLYDNAQLARCYIEAFQVTGDSVFGDVARETLDWLLARMALPQGGFASALDADSEGVEGKYYVWRDAEIRALLTPDEARAFCAFYGVSPQGNWEGQSVLHTPLPLPEVAQTLGQTRVKIEALLAAARNKLLAARREREPPGRDDKVLTAWNGLAISALAEACHIFQDDRYLKAASKTATFLQNNLVDSAGRLLRSWRDGRAGPTAFLDDYACLAEGMLALYEASGTPWHLEWALALGEEMLALFGADDGSLWAAGSDQESLYFRHREPLDGATPSPTGVAAQVLVRLGWHFARDDLRQAAEAIMAAEASHLRVHPWGCTSLLEAAQMLRQPPVELVLVGYGPTPEFDAALAAHFLPRRMLARHDFAVGDQPPFPALVGKPLVDGRPALYICRDFACREPVVDLEQVSAALPQHP
jgi:uncharacterized protein YyaL (SSP411 family)